MNTIPKSLHTVTAIANLTFHLQTQSGASPQPMGPDSVALDRACAILGYAGAEDPYGLKARAMKVYLSLYVTGGSL